MKCENCKKESDWTYVPEIKLWVSKLTDFGKSYDEIVKSLKEGERLLILDEAVKLVNSNPEIIEKGKGFWIQQPFKENKNKVAYVEHGFFFTGVGRFSLYADRDPDYRDGWIGRLVASRSASGASKPKPKGGKKWK